MSRDIHLLQRQAEGASLPSPPHFRACGKVAKTLSPLHKSYSANDLTPRLLCQRLAKLGKVGKLLHLGRTILNPLGQLPPSLPPFGQVTTLSQNASGREVGGGQLRGEQLE